MEKLRQNFGFFQTLRDDLVESSILKIQNYVRKVFLPARMEKKRLDAKGKKGKKKGKRTTTTKPSTNSMAAKVANKLVHNAFQAKVAPNKLARGITSASGSAAKTGSGA